MRVKLNPESEGVGKVFTIISIALVLGLNGFVLLGWFFYTSLN
tara:strand:+ start:636 stop:764 length:129 start_codon:yes stop_codon:yes gene_type:complete